MSGAAEMAGMRNATPPRVTDGSDDDLVIRDLAVAYHRKVVLQRVNARMARGQIQWPDSR